MAGERDFEVSELPALQQEVLFAEPGASWWWLLVGPGSAAMMIFIQVSSGVGFQPIVPAIFFLLVTGFLTIQVKAARIHTSVELTSTYLRQGAETLLIGEILKVYPPASGAEAPKWQSARALGELTGVPRRRTGIGVKLSNDRRAQAWARKHLQLRAALTELVQGRAS
jgi:hypothetical protein